MSYRKFQTYFFVGLLLASALLTLAVFRSYLVLLAFGGVFAIASRPLYKRFHKWFDSDTASAFLTVIVAATVVVLPMVLFAAGLTVEISNLLGGLKTHLSPDVFANALERYLPPQLRDQVPALMEEGSVFLRNLAQSISANLLALFSNALLVIFNFLIILISAYYLLKDGAAVKRQLLAISPLGDDHDDQVFRRVVTAVRAVITGTLIVGLVKGVVSALLFWVLGVPSPLFWGAMTGFASFIPMVGSSLITVPATIYLLAVGSYTQAVILGILSVAVIGTVDNFLQTFLVGSKTNIHPLLVLLSILGGLQFYGFAGFILGPLTLAVTMALLEIYEKDFRPWIDGMTRSSSGAAAVSGTAGANDGPEELDAPSK